MNQDVEVWIEAKEVEKDVENGRTKGGRMQKGGEFSGRQWRFSRGVDDLGTLGDGHRHGGVGGWNREGVNRGSGWNSTARKEK